MIAKEDLKKGTLYRVTSRNLLMGVFDGDRGIVGLREKLGSVYPFTEYLADGGAFGTVLVVEELEECPVADLSEGSSACETCGEPCAFDRARGETWEERWYHVREPEYRDHPARSAFFRNAELHAYLADAEKRFA